MNLLDHLKLRYLLPAALAAMAAVLLPACNSLIYDDEGDCSVTYRLTFRYDMNLKWADAFANEVRSVRVLAYDPQGNLVWQKTDRGDHLAHPGYSMTLDLPAGDYHLVAWCGLDNADPRESFSLAGNTDAAPLTALRCALNTSPGADHPAVSDTRLHPLFHGALDLSLPANDDGAEYTWTMPLTKDTNHVRVILQHLSGEDVDVDDFRFSITDNNGMMAHDNSIVPHRDVLYRTWNTMSGQAGVGKDDTPVNPADPSRAIITVNGAIADLTVGRMLESHRHDMMLNITGRFGETVAAIPVIDYALLAKDYYEDAYGHAMTPQEFLDREDEYVMTLFLDANHKWIASSILIHSWKIVINNYDID